MANPGNGNRYVSVNLNKSYGQSSHPNHSISNNYGSSRGRSAGGSSGMVVLSWPRSSHKPGQKLSIPPPLNLPSLRKEHERFDSLGSGSGTAGGGVAGSGARPSSSGMGWSKPSAIVAAERDVVDGCDQPLSSDGVAPGLQAVDGVSRGVTTAYMPPSARLGSAGPDVSAPVPIQKATVLRGEDFPSLRATLTTVNGPVQKQKDPAHQKQRQGLSEDTSGWQNESSRTSSHIDMRPQLQSSQHSVGRSISGNGSNNNNSVDSHLVDERRKQDDFLPGLLPLVRLSPRSDWADDERDTSHGLMERGRDHGFSRNEAYWDMDIEWSRSSFLPHKPARNNFDRRGQRDNDVGKGLSNEVSNADSFSQDVRSLSREGREGHSWRTPAYKDGFTSQDNVNDRNSMGATPTCVNRETTIENKYSPSKFGGNTQNEYNVGLAASRDFSSGRRDPGYVEVGRQQRNYVTDPTNSRGAERDRYSSESNRYRVDTAPNNMGSRLSLSSGSKGLSGSDHFSNFGRGKRSFARGEKPYVEDPFLKDWGNSGFDGNDPFSGGILGVAKRKKDANKHLDFHDPARESFEAELERVQKIQEQERQRAIEEQERAMVMARREEEERQRHAREQEECQRRVEEEAREAAWRAEQEKLEALRRAEEQRIAREDEKQRMLMEEERRKQAAKQKLLELEERIARRQAEAPKGDDSASIQGDLFPGEVKERDVSRADDFTGWEDGERMVERITNTASSDSSIRPFDMGSRSIREGSFSFAERGKPFNSWRRDVFDNGNNSTLFPSDHENGHQSPRQDGSIGGRAFPRKDFYGGMPTRGYYRGGIAEAHMDDFPPARNISSDGDPYGRNREFEAEFHENIAGKFDVGWGQDRARGNFAFSERLYENSELDELYTYGRSRYPARQPRVLPPPSLHLVHRTSFSNECEHTGSSAYEDGNIQFNRTFQRESSALSYQNAHDEDSDALDVREQSAINGEQELNRSTNPGFDSQSSLSVSSPPSSPTHLSHDDLDESRDSLAVSATADGQDILYAENEVHLNVLAGKVGMLTAASSISVDDEEEWTVENNEELQQQDEYDEDAGYHEDEVHEVDDENVELSREFEDMHLEEKDSHITDNVVLGFDQGVEVGMPNDEYELSPKIDESLYAGHRATVGVTEQKGSFEGCRDGPNPQVADVPQLVSTDGSSLTVQETKKAVPDYVSEPINSSHPSTSLDPMNAENSPSGTVPSAQQSVPSPVGANSQSSSQAVMPSELPVKLQFGLFSGPSLIPSPVPAIQIGSIQMPLHLHPQVGPSLTHMHAPQPPLFQFGQLSYASSISQGILPLGPPSMSCVQSNGPPSYPSSQKFGGPLCVQPVQDSSAPSVVKDDSLPLIANSRHMQPPNHLNMSQDTEKEANVISRQGAESNVLLHQNQADASSARVDQVRTESGQQVDSVRRPYSSIRNQKPLLNNRASKRRSQGGHSSSNSPSTARDSSVSALQGQLPGSNGGRSAFTARNPGAKLSSIANRGAHTDANGFHRRPRHVTQRFEFRVRQATDGEQSSALLLSNNTGLDAESNSDGKGSGKQLKSGSKKEILSDKPKQRVDSKVSYSEQFITEETGSLIVEDKLAGKEVSASGLNIVQQADGSLKRNISSEDDVDPPLQSGIVRVYKQPGIEGPSDEDDFIEVRSKRQMLNDRREQRVREIKAKSSNMRKSQPKPCAASQGTAAVRSTTKTFVSLSAQAAKSIRHAVTSKQGLINNEVSASNNAVSQTLNAIGNAPTNADDNSQIIKSSQTSSYSTSGQTVESDLTFSAQCKVIDGVHSSVGSWGNSQINQQVMALTQTQLEDAMNPAQFDKQKSSIRDQASSVSEPGMPSSSVLAKGGPFSSPTSPISSLLAGEKIQFGAVTSPTILPPSTRVVSHGMRPPASSQSMPASENLNDSALLIAKEKNSNESCPALEDCEAEAEAAASAVVVAAIGNDEVAGNGIGACSASIPVPKGFGGAYINGMTAGMSCEQQLVSQSKAEEGLSVSLPADLSVETPPMSLWPPLPSPHTSSQMLSPFPGGPTSHFPFYDMNPMMGRPVFAFGPHEESAGTQSQTQKNSVPNSAPLGTWQQCHTGVDSFYGPPAGFTTPFVGPPGSIPGVRGPPHMVVYNHFAPVGQFGQVGLSYMGTAYIPSGKQPDWKHNTTLSAMGGGEEGMNNMKIVPVQRNAPNIPTQIQHLAPGSPLLSMTSPLAMFEVSPFQNAPDPSSVHPRWSHVQASSLPSIPQSMPLQQQAEDDRSFSLGTNATVTQFPDGLGLVDPPAAASAPEASALNKSLPGSTSADAVRVVAMPEGSGTKWNPQAAASASHKTQSTQQKNPAGAGQPQYNHYHKRSTQKNGSGAEWSNRKMGFHGRNLSSGGERGFPSTKVKQIYVAKHSAGGPSSAV